MSSDRRRSQAGFTLAGLIVILTIVAMVLAYSVPQMWSDVMRRERELQTIFVMKQYARGIAEFQKARGALPVSIDQLAEQNNPRALRQKWPNPLTGKMDWVLVPVGTPSRTQGPPGSVPPGGQMPGGQQQQPRPSRPQPGGGGGQQVGAFIGVRPGNSGDAMIELNGATTYEEWIYTVNDLQQEQGQNTVGPPGSVGVPLPRP